jgi:general stress protein 26
MASKGSTSTDRVWEIIETVGIAMLTTSFPGGLRARPVEARPERDAGLIWFVTDLRSGKEHEIEAEHDVGLVFIDAKAKVYLSITARAEVRRDHAKAAEIWKRSDNMWWKGPDDPNVCVLRVRPLTAELWDGPASAAVAAFEFVKARITGKKPNLGENRKVTVRMARTTVPRKSAIAARKRPSTAYRIIWKAIRARKQIVCSYKNRPREVFPHILGYKASGEEVIHVPGRRRELTAAAARRRLALLRSRWHRGHSGTRRLLARRRPAPPGTNLYPVCRCRRQRAGNASRPQPLAFGSPGLRPPRQPGE